MSLEDLLSVNQDDKLTCRQCLSSKPHCHPGSKPDGFALR